MPRDTYRNDRERQMRKTGTGLSWGDWIFRPSGARLPGVSDPRLGQYMDDGAVSTGVYGYHFDAGEIVPLLAEQIDHDYLVGSTIYPHVHFKLVNAPVIGETVIWTVEYEVGPVVGAGPSTTSSSTGTYTFDAADAQWDNVLLDLLPTVSGATLTISSVGSVTLTRAGDYGSEVLFMGFDFHYQKDSIGSDEEDSKTY